MILKVSRMVLAVFFVVAGVNHFISPEMYLPLMPAYLPWHLGLIYLSGVAEAAGGLGILPKTTRRWAGWWLIAVLVAVFPANVHMLMNDVPLNGKNVPQWVLWARLPMQAVMIAWVYVSCVKRRN